MEKCVRHYKSDFGLNSKFNYGNRLLSVKDLCSFTPTWAVTPVTNFVKNFADVNNNFPCNFAHQVYQDQSVRLSFFEENNDEISLLESLKNSLTEYIKVAPSLGQITSFLTFFNLNKTSMTVEEYES